MVAAECHLLQWHPISPHRIPNEKAMDAKNGSQGPWRYTDPDGNDYLLQVVPMERDATLAESRQPKAVVFQTAEGWIRVTPVGHDFSPSDLSEADLALLLKVAAGPADRT